MIKSTNRTLNPWIPGSLDPSHRSRINILYIIWSLGLGGAEQVVINLAKGLDRAKFNPIVCCLNDKGVFSAELEKQGIKVIPLNKRGKFDICVIYTLICVIKQYKIDIVHTHLWGANFWGRIAAKLAGVPVVIASEHNTDTWKNGFHFALDRFLSRWTDRVVAVSESVKGFYVSKGIRAEKVRVIHNGIEVERERGNEGSRHLGIEASRDRERKETTLAVIGRLVPQKGHKYFLLALRALLEDYKVRGLIVGSGPMEKELRRFSDTIGLNGGVEFTGLRQDIPELLKSIDILVLPSLREGLSLVAMEAMACGLPVVATAVGGTPEVVSHGETGLLVAPENAWELTTAITRLLSDKEYARRLGENGRNRVKEHFSVDRMVAEHERLYKECIERKVKR